MRRYGRNQKRKARQTIADLESKVDQLMKKIDQNKGLVESARQVCDVADRVSHGAHPITDRPLRYDGRQNMYACNTFSDGLRAWRVDLVSLELCLEKVSEEAHFVCSGFHPDLGRVTTTYCVTLGGLKYVNELDIARILVLNIKDKISKAQKK